MGPKKFRKKLSILMVVMFLFNMGYVPPSFAATPKNESFNSVEKGTKSVVGDWTFELVKGDEN